ncbi:unnamed protein product, partial [Ectocarpus sp. 8 AP-2014]
CAHVPLGALLHLARRPPGAERRGADLEEVGGISPSPAVTRLLRALCGLEAESDEAARMTPSRETSTLFSTQRSETWPSSTMTAIEASTSRMPDIAAEKRRKEKRGKKEGEKHPKRDSPGSRATPRSTAYGVARVLPSERFY